MLKIFFKVNDYSRAMNITLLVLRLAITVSMLTHGLPKLEKVLSGNFNFADPLGLGPTTSLILTAFAEFLCSVLIGIGLGTRLAAIPLIITMTVILFIVHGDEPIFSHYNVLLYLTGYFILLISGSGRYSSDYYLPRLISSPR